MFHIITYLCESCLAFQHFISNSISFCEPTDDFLFLDSNSNSNSNPILHRASLANDSKDSRDYVKPSNWSKSIQVLQ